MINKSNILRWAEKHVLLVPKESRNILRSTAYFYRLENLGLIYSPVYNSAGNLAA